ncbi:NAD(P)/FAD-dependent oxidoreductase [Brenneria corticis]|nr:FAD-dependent oxidoreductase [Brenneria sp. CFCC 11842]
MFDKATSMQSDPLSFGLWEASAPPAPQTAALTTHLDVDIAVIGAGYTGLSTALHCAKGGAVVAVLEAKSIGYGGSGRNVGLVNAGMWVMPEILTRTLGTHYGDRLLNLLGDAPDLVYELIKNYDIECEAVHNGTIHCAVGSRGLREIRERCRQWADRGAPVEVLDAEETARRTGTRAYAGSLFDRRTGTVQPLGYVRGLAHAALREGAQIYTATPVTQIHDAGTHWELSTSGSGTVSARKVVVATESYTLEESPWGQLCNELVYLPYFNFATRPLTAEQQREILPNREGAWDTRTVLSSFRFDQQGRLVFGSVGALRGHGLSVHHQWGRRALTKLYPQLQDIPFEYEWYGEIGMTNDNLPRLHKLARDTYTFCGYNGRGIAPGTTLGREMARLVLEQAGEQDMPLPVTTTASASLRGIRNQMYEQGASLVHFMDARF